MSVNASTEGAQRIAFEAIMRLLLERASRRLFRPVPTSPDSRRPRAETGTDSGARSSP